MVEATGLILAGGKSRRMGVDKAFLEVGNEAMIESVAAKLKTVFSEILICGGNRENGSRLGLRVVSDIVEGGGPLSGIHAGLIQGKYQKCFVTACDMPFVNARLAEFMVKQAEGYDIAVPCHGSYLQPLFAVYDKSCLPAISETLKASRYKVVDFYPRVRVNYVNGECLRRFADTEVVFFNVNTPVDLDRARDLARKKKNEGVRD
mgnify:CR=1 FL=1